MRSTFTYEQGQKIRQARADYQAAREAGRRVDIVDVATETGNYWWNHLDDRSSRLAARFIVFGREPLQ